MTSRVIDCGRPPQLHAAHKPGRYTKRPAARGTGLPVAVLTALVLVPLASAGQASIAWVACGIAAISILLAGAVAGPRIPWSWLAALSGGAVLVLPRGPADLYPGVLLICCALACVFWLANRRRGGPQ